MRASRADAPLKTAIENGQLVIRIGVNTLAYCAEHCPLFYDHEKNPDAPYVKVLDNETLARDIVRELEREQEDGSSPLSDLFDEVTLAAFDDGSLAFYG